MIRVFLILLSAWAGFLPAFAFSTEKNHATLAELAAIIAARESSTPGLKKGAEARLEFFTRERPRTTPLAFLYLHGFSASPRESSPLVEDLAREWKANAYFPRYKGHGIEGPNGLEGVKLADWERETKEALRTARQLGEQVVVIAMSTGASLAISALQHEQTTPLLLLSPNFRLHRPESALLRLPFGPWIARLFLGAYHQWEPRNKDQEYFWTTQYPSATAVEAVKAAAKANNAGLEKIRAPVFMAYSAADTVIHIPSLKKAYQRIGSSKKEIWEVPAYLGEDPHIIAGQIVSPQSSAFLSKKISKFLTDLPTIASKSHQE